MSSKNAIKIINIQKSYLVHIGSIWFIMSSSVQFFSIQSIWSYLVHYVHQSSIIYSVLFSPRWPYLVHIGPSWFTEVIFGPFCLLWSYLVHYVYFGFNFVLFGPYWFYLVHFVHFDPLQSYSGHLVHLGLIHSILFTLVLFSPFCPLWSY